MALSPDLAGMIDRLAAMPAGDREFVLGQLGSEGERQLLPLLEKARQVEISPGMKALLARAENGGELEGMTRRAAEALVRAARHGRTDDVPVVNSSPLGQSRPFVARLMQRLGLES